MKTVCFYPTNQKRTNHFLYNLSSLLESSGKFNCLGYKEVKKKSSKQIFSADVYHINWFDQSKDVISFFKRLYFLLMLKIKGKRIVWTIHNVQSHIKTPFYNRFLFKLLVKLSNVIHIMCKETIAVAHLERYADKVKLIPHGDYYGSYPESDFDVRHHYGIESDKPIFLFMGAVQPYKNIEVLVKAFNKAFAEKENSPALLICGKVTPESYLDSINKIVDGSKNIFFDPQFIPDEKLSAYIKAATVLVAPYSYRSSLISGTIPLAFSYGKTILCPDIPCVKDIVAESDCMYDYHYDSENDHIDILSRKMQEVCDDAKTERLLNKEKNAVAYMKCNSWENHKSEWMSLYEAEPC